MVKPTFIISILDIIKYKKIIKLIIKKKRDLISFLFNKIIFRKKNVFNKLLYKSCKAFSYDVFHFHLVHLIVFKTISGQSFTKLNL